MPGFASIGGASVGGGTQSAVFQVSTERIASYSIAQLVAADRPAGYLMNFSTGTVDAPLGDGYRPRSTRSQARPAAVQRNNR